MKKSFLINICIVMVIGALTANLLRYKQYSNALNLQIATQQKTLETLTAERDSCKNKKPEVIACPVVTPPPAEPQTDVQAVLDPRDGDNQTKMDALKKRYEEILVTYFVLRKCEKVQPTDYHVIISALAQEMASINAPGRLQYDILTSAQGSYKELYSGNTCDAQTIVPLQEQYKTFVDAISEEFLPK